MSGHSLSLRTQILLHFPAVADARFEWRGWQTVFYADVRGDHSLRESIKRFLDERGLMATQVVLADDWVAGRPWPEVFDRFTDVQRELMESCDSTGPGMEAVMLQLCGWVADVRSDTISGGHIQLTVQTRGGLQPAQSLLDECQALALGALGVPGVRIDVVVGTVPATELFDPGSVSPQARAILRWMENQSSREGIKDPILRRLFDEDEDYYRDARERGFVARRASTAEHQDAESGVFLPASCKDVDARNLLLVFDHIYFPASAYTETVGQPTVYGVSRAEIPRLVSEGKFVPVFTERLGRHEQLESRALVEAGRCIYPRRLASWVGSQILDSNPLWRTPKSEILLAREALSAVRREVNGTSAKLPAGLIDITAAWLEFETDGCANFMMAMTNQSTRVPLAYGPGAFAAKVLGKVLGDRAPDLEAQTLGVDVSYAAALGVACFPVPFERLYPLYNLIGSLTASRPIGTIEQLPILYSLDTLIDELELACPDDMTLDTWLEFVNEHSPRELRLALAKALGDGCTDIAAAREAAKSLGARVAAVVQASDRQARLTDKFEFVGIIADGLLLTGAVPDLPFGSSIVGFMLKTSASWLWEKLELHPALRDAKIMLESVNHLEPPSVIRILHMRRKLSKRLRAQNA